MTRATAICAVLLLTGAACLNAGCSLLDGREVCGQNTPCATGEPCNNGFCGLACSADQDCPGITKCRAGACICEDGDCACDAKGSCPPGLRCDVVFWICTEQPGDGGPVDVDASVDASHDASFDASVDDTNVADVVTPDAGNVDRHYIDGPRTDAQPPDHQQDRGELEDSASMDSSAPTARHIYRSVGALQDNLNTSGHTVAIAGRTATFSDAMPDNIGVGDVLAYQCGYFTWQVAFISGRSSSIEYTVQNAAGDDPNPCPADTWVAVYRAYNTLAYALIGYENPAIHFTVGDFDQWYQGRDLVTANEVWNIACYDDGVDSTPASLVDWNTDTDHYLRVFTPVTADEVGVSQRHSGTWGSGYRRTRQLEIRVPYARVQGLAIRHGRSGEHLFAVQNLTEAGRIELSYNYGMYVGSGSRMVFQVRTDVPIRVDLYNNIAVNESTDNIARGFNVTAESATVYIYANTARSRVGAAFHHNAGIVHWKNNLGRGGAVGAFDGEPTSVAHCASIDSSADDWGGPGNLTQVNPAFLDLSERDLHLSFWDQAITEKGLDLSADPNLAFGDDIDGQPRSGRWDIGADQGPDIGVETRFDAHGAGTNSEPYLLGTPEQWMSLAQTPAAWGHHYKLIQDIDLAGVAGDHAPIGDQATPFSGSFDGNQKIVRHFRNSSGASYMGLFGHVNVTENLDGIHDIALQDASVVGADRCGALVGYMQNGRLESLAAFGQSCLVNCTGVACGGLVGESGTEATLSKVFSTCRVSADGDDVGGLVGRHGGTLAEGYYAHSTQPVVGGSHVGGLVGWNSGGHLASTFAAAAVQGNSSATDVALNIGVSDGTIAGCYYDLFWPVSNLGSAGIHANGTPVDSNAVPGYFFSSHNPPLDGWDFAQTWVERTADHPTLRWLPEPGTD